MFCFLVEFGRIKKTLSRGKNVISLYEKKQKQKSWGGSWPCPCPFH
jgi:hypothetical protein